MKKLLIAAAAILVGGFLVIQTVNAGPGGTFGFGERGYRGPTCGAGAFGGFPSALTDEQIAQREAYSAKAWELRDEFRKDTIDGDKIARLRDELSQMRAEMGLPERTERGYREGRMGRPGTDYRDYRFGRPFCDISLTEEDIAQREAYSAKTWELRKEFRKDTIDGDKIARLRDELSQMRAEMGLPAERGRDFRGSRGGGYFQGCPAVR